MNASDLTMGAYFTTTGKDIWKLDGYFDMPSCTLRRLDEPGEETFGMGGVIAESFKRIDMPVVPPTEAA